MAHESYPELLVALDGLSTNLKGRLGDAPHMTVMQTDLEAWVAEARGLEAQTEIFEARLRETNEKRRVSQQRGIDLRSQLNGALRGHFGPKSQTLREFGFLPRGRKRSAKKEEPPKPEGPPPAPTA
ncbi:MAG TPA: hypothetical protein VNJ70_06440 [Thermoanaerobaculia bacterium]|nr:hypothetical protein [Thermoanaerobaculia bacterium]